MWLAQGKAMEEIALSVVMLAVLNTLEALEIPDETARWAARRICQQVAENLRREGLKVVARAPTWPRLDEDEE